MVEDDHRFAIILRDLVREMDFQCIVTHSANDGLVAARQYKPSGIVLDVNLPDHSGLGVLDFMKRTTILRCDAEALRAIGPAAVALGYGEAVWPWLVAGVVTAGSGLLLDQITGRLTECSQFPR